MFVVVNRNNDAGIEGGESGCVVGTRFRHDAKPYCSR
jgi:hypothetical protein